MLFLETGSYTRDKLELFLFPPQFPVLGLYTCTIIYSLYNAGDQAQGFMCRLGKFSTNSTHFQHQLQCLRSHTVLFGGQGLAVKPYLTRVVRDPQATAFECWY